MPTESERTFVQVARISELPDPGKMVLEIDDRLVVLVCRDGEYFCIDDVCTHDGGPLSDGEMEDHCLICPRHGAKFDFRTGEALCMPATEPTKSHEVRLDGDQILIRLND